MESISLPTRHENPAKESGKKDETVKRGMDSIVRRDEKITGDPEG